MGIYLRTHTYIKYHLKNMVHLYTHVQTYMQRYLRTHTYIKPPPMLVIHLKVLINYYTHRSLCASHSPAQETVCKNIHETYPGYIKFSDNMSGWGSASLDIPSGWGTKDTELNNWEYNCPTNRAPGCAVIFPNHIDAMFLEVNRPLKRREIEKGALFNLLPTYVINVIGNWISGIEHSAKIKTVVILIHVTLNPVLRIATYYNWNYLTEFMNVSLYNTIRYELADIHYDKSEHGWGADSPWVRHKHG